MSLIAKITQWDDKHKRRRFYLDVLKVHFYVKDNILTDLSESKYSL
jgi:hypothetical protein